MVVTYFFLYLVASISVLYINQQWEGIFNRFQLDLDGILFHFYWTSFTLSSSILSFLIFIIKDVLLATKFYMGIKCIMLHTNARQNIEIRYQKFLIQGL